jgi:alcohol dehydrogenase
VGLAAVAIARSRGAFVCAVDVSAASLDRALFHGADEVVDASIGPEKVLAAVTRWSPGGVAVSVDALGSPEACRTGILALGRRGRHVQVGLLLADQASPPVPMDRVVARELEIRGSHGMQAHRYGAMLALIEAGRLAPGKLVGRRISLEESIAALTSMDRFEGAGVTVVTSFQAHR